MIKQFMLIGRNNFANLLTHHTIRTVIELGKGTVRMDSDCNFPSNKATVTIGLSSTSLKSDSKFLKVFKTYKELENKSDVLLQFSDMESLYAMQVQLNEAAKTLQKRMKKEATNG